jgi:hypothetical protein
MYSHYIILLILLIILISLLYIGILYNFKKETYDTIKKQKIKLTIEWLYQTINEICYECKIYPSYKIKHTNEFNYYENNNGIIIYLDLWDKINDRIIGHNTLILETLHQLACAFLNNYNISNLDIIEKKLINTAISLDYYNMNIKLER